MTWNEAKASEPGTVSKLTFYSLVIVTSVLFAIIEMTAVLAVSRAIGYRIEGGWIVGLGSLNGLLALLAVDGVLKRFGLSRSGKTLEIRERSTVLPEGEVADDETVEVRVPSSFITRLGVMCLACGMFMALLLAVISPDGVLLVGMSYAIVAFFGFGALYCFYERLWGKPQAWAESSGIWALPVGFHMRARFVPWSNVATCEIETLHNTFGKPVVIRPILKGADGKLLMTPNLKFTRLEDQEQLIKYIRAKLPKTKLDLWD